MGALALILAVIAFVLAGFGVNLGQVDAHELSYFGLALFALGHLLGGTLGDLSRRF